MGEWYSLVLFYINKNTYVSLFQRPMCIDDMPRGIFSGLKRTLRLLLMKHGIECIRAYSEADPVIVKIAQERQAYGIVSDDSDSPSIKSISVSVYISLSIL